MLILDADRVRELYRMRDAIDLMAEALRRYSAGQVSQPLRTIVRPPAERGLLGTMPCHVSGERDAGFGLKAMVLKPDNPARGLDLHIGLIMVFDPDTGAPLAVVDANAVTEIRTAAVSAVATDLLADRNADDLAILGSGVQARGHLAAMALVRPPRRVRIWSRTLAHAERLAAWAGGWLRAEIVVVAEPADAVHDANLLCTTMASQDPVVEADWLADGAHLNVVGGSFPDARELTSAAVARCSVFVDSRESAAAESGDLRAPLAEGLIGPDHVRAEIGEVLLGKQPGRRDAREITLFKSLGLAVEDVMSGFHVARLAREAS